MTSESRDVASAVARPTAMREHVVLTLEQLRECCEWYQKLLRLQDWGIRVLMVREREIGGNLGQIKVNDSWKSATLRVATHDDYDVDGYANDMEHTVVHELLHLVLWDCKVDGDTREGQYEERGINHLATALVELARANRGSRQWVSTS